MPALSSNAWVAIHNYSYSNSRHIHFAACSSPLTDRATGWVGMGVIEKYSWAAHVHCASNTLPPRSALGSVPYRMASSHRRHRLVRSLRSVAAVGARLSGFVPPMASLHSLMLQGQRGSRLSGTLPASSWPLEAFYLGHNRLSGTLPSTISTPIVDLDANAFTGALPSTYTDAVRVLKISCGSPPSAAGGQVSGGGGCLSGTLPTGLGMASNLEWLELENNQLSGSLPAAVFSGLRSLTTLYLRGNDLSGEVPDGLLPTCAAPSCACDLSGNCFDSDKVPAACEGSTPGQQPSCEGPTPAPTPAPTPPVDPPTPTPTPNHPDDPPTPTPKPTPHPPKPTPTQNSMPGDDSYYGEEAAVAVKEARSA